MEFTYENQGASTYLVYDIGFLVVALIAVGLVFNAGGVKDVLLELFNKIIGA